MQRVFSHLKGGKKPNAAAHIPTDPLTASRKAVTQYQSLLSQLQKDVRQFEAVLTAFADDRVKQSARQNSQKIVLDDNEYEHVCSEFAQAMAATRKSEEVICSELSSSRETVKEMGETVERVIIMMETVQKNFARRDRMFKKLVEMRTKILKLNGQLAEAIEEPKEVEKIQKEIDKNTSKMDSSRAIFRQFNVDFQVSLSESLMQCGVVGCEVLASFLLLQRSFYSKIATEHMSLEAFEIKCQSAAVPVSRNTSCEGPQNTVSTSTTTSIRNEDHYVLQHPPDDSRKKNTDVTVEKDNTDKSGLPSLPLDTTSPLIFDVLHGSNGQTVSKFEQSRIRAGLSSIQPSEFALTARVAELHSAKHVPSLQENYEGESDTSDADSANVVVDGGIDYDGDNFGDSAELKVDVKQDGKKKDDTRRPIGEVNLNPTVQPTPQQHVESSRKLSNDVSSPPISDLILNSDDQRTELKDTDDMSTGGMEGSPTASREIGETAESMLEATLREISQYTDKPTPKAKSNSSRNHNFKVDENRTSATKIRVNSRPELMLPAHGLIGVQEFTDGRSMEALNSARSSGRSIRSGEFIEIVGMSKSVRSREPPHPKKLDSAKSHARI